MPALTFGIMSFCRIPYGELANRFRQAEELGFTSAWVDDDILTPGFVDFEAWTLLAALARETTSIRLGTLVTVPTFRHPSFLAAQVITVDHLSDGRAQLGLGAGGPPNNYGAFGHDVWGPSERAERLEEQVEIIDGLLRGEKVAIDGAHYEVNDAQLTPPVQKPRPPIVIAAHGERGLRLAARHADGWNTLGGQPYRVAQDPAQRVSLRQSVETTKQLSLLLDKCCEERGRDPLSVRRSVLAYRPVVDPLSSLDAFDEYVGRYAEIGVTDFNFYWPPLDNVFPRGSGTEPGQFMQSLPLDSAQQLAFERIATDRIRIAGNGGVQ